MRRFAVAGLCVLMLMQLPAMAAGTDPATAGAAWLEKLDEGYYGATWSESSKLFHSRVSSADWTAKIKEARNSLGALVSRGKPDVALKEKMPGAPDGHYAVLQYHTTFAHENDAVETLVLVQEEDGQWKTAGYFIR